MPYINNYTKPCKHKCNIDVQEKQNTSASSATEDRDKKSLNFKLYIGAGILIVAFVIIYFISGQNSTKQVPKGTVFVIGNVAYSQDEVKAIIAYPLDHMQATRDSLTMQVYDYLKREQVAKNLNIQPTAQEISYQAQATFGANSQYSKMLSGNTWFRLVSYDDALQQNISSGNFGQYQGYSLIFWFGQHLETGPLYTAPDFGDSQLVAQDQSYALSQAKYYYNLLKTNKISADNAFKAVSSNTKLSYSFPNNVYDTQSVHFGINTYETWRNQVRFPEVIDYIAKQTKSGLSTIGTGKVAIVDNPKSNNDYRDGFYYIVDLTSAHYSPSITQNAFTNDVNKLSSRYYGW